MDLNEQLTDHLSPQSLTDIGELPRGLRSAAFAGQPNIQTKLGIIVFRGGMHVLNIMPLTLTPTKGFEEGFAYLNCGGWYTPNRSKYHASFTFAKRMVPRERLSG
jgi:hypothetical protein